MPSLSNDKPGCPKSTPPRLRANATPFEIELYSYADCALVLPPSDRAIQLTSEDLQDHRRRSQQRWARAGAGAALPGSLHALPFFSLSFPSCINGSSAHIHGHPHISSILPPLPFYPDAPTTAWNFSFLPLFPLSSLICALKLTTTAATFQIDCVTADRSKFCASHWCWSQQGWQQLGFLT